MGMAASQARLLCITARIHDVEHQAQAIQNAKLQLGIQSDRVYNEYVAALDATTMTVKTFDPNSAQSATVAATFNNLCSRNRAYVAGGVNYAIHVNGWLLVEDEIEEKYQKAMELSIDNAHDFAIYMLYDEKPSSTPPPRPNPDPEHVDMYNYFKSIFNQIQASGGCVSIADYGDKAANDSEWLKKMIESGVFTISTVEEIDEDDDGEKDYAKFRATSPGSDTNLAYTTTTEVDNTALKKAEAKYENDMRKINQKDKQFDLDLSKLETERSALTTQYDSIKKVIEDNIERTFGIFS